MKGGRQLMGDDVRPDEQSSSQDVSNPNPALKPKSNKKTVIIISIIALIIIAILGSIIWYLVTRADKPQKKVSRGVVATADNVDELIKQDEASNGVAEGYTAQMNMDWNFGSSTEPSSNAYVKNSEENEHTIYFDVVLSNAAHTETEGEILYSSPYIPVGSEISDIALEKHLDPGDYNAIVVYHIVDEENDNEELSTVNVAITLHIQG